MVTLVFPRDRNFHEGSSHRSVLSWEWPNPGQETLGEPITLAHTIISPPLSMVLLQVVIKALDFRGWEEAAPGGGMRDRDGGRLEGQDVQQLGDLEGGMSGNQDAQRSGC